MINYFPNATPKEQLNLWYNGNDEEHKLATYLEGVYQEYYENGQEDESRYETGFEVGYDTGYIDGQEK